MGIEGSIGLEGNKLVRQAPLTVDVVDTSGVSDVFLGGYCYGRMKDLSLESCLRSATAAAGLSCRALGARAGLPSAAEIDIVA
jgi:sugar/nucleoside kinase (ribokinase family)